MPKRARNPSKAIRDRERKKVTFCKKKKDLIKRAMELSMMCEAKILLVVFDKKK